MAVAEVEMARVKVVDGTSSFHSDLDAEAPDFHHFPLSVGGFAMATGVRHGRNHGTVAKEISSGMWKYRAFGQPWNTANSWKEAIDSCRRLLSSS